MRTFPLSHFIGIHLFIFQISDVLFSTTLYPVVDEALHYFIERSELRVILLNALTSNGVEGLKKLRPTPDAYAIIADTRTAEKLFKKVTILDMKHCRGLKLLQI